MATCPSGHDSASDDFCDVCGIRIGAATEFPPSPAAAPPGRRRHGHRGRARGRRSLPAVRCRAHRPVLRVLRPRLHHGDPGSPGSPSALSPVAPSPAATPAARATWTAVVTADRLYFDRVVATVGADAPELSFPAYCPERRFPLSGTEVRVGRRSVSRGIDPEIDLTGPPADPGVSRLHALLVAEPDGTWSVVDPGSENGTLLNGNTIPANQAVALHDGDRIHLGAWTALTITRDPEVIGG